jgi:4-coumarate--CoA ligase
LAIHATSSLDLAGRKEQATRDAIVVDPDGTRWLKTGDIAYVNEYKPGGIFHIVDRLKELIKVKGNQVAPAELEALLLERPDVIDAAVVGVTINGEELPRAYVQKSPESKASEKDIADWLAKTVAKYKQLKGGVAFIDSVPKNPVSGPTGFHSWNSVCLANSSILVGQNLAEEAA